MAAAPVTNAAEHTIAVVSAASTDAGCRLRAEDGWRPAIIANGTEPKKA